jgi:bifunctional non-homologous end joining protein LigD
LSQITTIIDNINIKLSNLEKLLWPNDGITKAELIQYYLSIWEYMKPLVENRPLTLIRYPDGIDGNKFYSKNAPDFIPDWLPTSKHSDIKYIHLEKSADLVYAANLAALELHAMTQTTKQNLPDTIIFDLDPSSEISFAEIKDICQQLCEMLTNFNYHPHIKTSGSKGLHIYVPIVPQYSREVVFNTAKAIGQAFTDINKSTTLKISKESRHGKLLIDIYRNHQSQTCVAPLSTRAKPGAPVSMPLLIEDLKMLHSSNQYTIHNALDYLKSNKPWNDYYRLQSILHTEIIAPSINAETNSNLETYNAKRDFTKTAEPVPIVENTPSQNRYVIQMHDASNLHYDLRLEENGVLTSWAIPKSLPIVQGIKRLAIRTEDHPLKYLDFEGVIPANEYGGGTMWVYDTGNFQIIKKEEKSYRILLKNGCITGEYALYNTKDNQWIVELKSDNKKIEIAKPMLSEQVTDVPNNAQYFFELKWDGIRVTIIKEGEKITILSRSGRDITEQFPEIAEKLKDVDAEATVLDGELVCLNAQGAPVFANIISRMHTKSKSNIEAASRNNPAVLYLFDLTYLDGKNCVNLPIEKRRDWLNIRFKKSERIRLSDAFEDGASLFEGAKALGLEGIMAKRKDSKYTADKRSTDWLKIKVRTMIDVVVIGYTKGKGDRIDVIGSLHVAKYENEKIIYLGKVGTGFDEAMLLQLFNLLNALPKITKPIKDVVDEEQNSVWIENGPSAEVQYASITPNGTLREPVFYRLKEE